MMAKSKVPDIAGAEKKLRQAEYFMGWLEHASKETARQHPDCLEFLFSACLSAAQSVYYVLEETGGPKFKQMRRDWRKKLKNDPGGSRFGRMIGLRGDDVHLGTTGAIPLQKYVEDDLRSQFPYHQPFDYDATPFGPAPVIEEVNPDGMKVRGSVLRGAVGLYLDRDGGHVEATTACRDFIDQLRSLLDATKAAFQ